MAVSKKYDYLYIAKGIAMFAVIWGHVMLSGNTHTLVYGFDIPLFFFLSGMVFNKEKYPKFSDFFKARAKRLLIPYAIYSVLTWCTWILLSLLVTPHKLPEDFFNPLLQTVFAQGSSGFLIHNTPLWFVTCLFVVEMLYYFICKAKPAVNIAICIILAAVGYLMIQSNDFFDFTLLPWNIEGAFRALIFYALGHNFTNNFGFEKIYEWMTDCKPQVILAWVVSTLAFIGGALYNGHVSIGSNIVGKSNIYFYIISLFGITSAMIFSAALDLLLQKKSFAVTKYIKWIGINSFCFMAIHKALQIYIMAVFKSIGIRLDIAMFKDVQHNFPASLITYIIVVPLTSIAVLLLNKFLDAVKTHKKKA